MCGPETDTGSVIKPQSTPFRLFLRNLQTLLTPDTLHPLVVYLPTIPSQQGPYPSISITAIYRMARVTIAALRASSSSLTLKTLR
jgi:hypothetical protein|tara:strand:+ start:763 stop:1017 length:255 start_codon:yes stop_codon:yes gene_type:complete